MTLTSILDRRPIRLGLALAFGAIGTLAFSPFNLWPASLISLSALLALTLNRTPKAAMGVGFFWGLGLFGSGVNWVYVSIDQFGGLPVPISMGMVLLLASYLSLYPMLFTGLLARFWPKADACMAGSGRTRAVAGH